MRRVPRIWQAANPTSVTYRAMRSLGFACAGHSSRMVKIRADRRCTAPGSRWPGQDSLLLFVEKDPDHLERRPVAGASHLLSDTGARPAAV